jgi:magnesium transporter
MHRILVERNGGIEHVDAIDPGWLGEDAPERLWVDIQAPNDEDRALLTDVFSIHELAVEDAVATIHHPKIESYNGLLYLILHGITATDGLELFETQDVDFLVGRNYLITVHQGPSRSIAAEQETCRRRPDLFADGPMGIVHRVIDRLVEHYQPAVDAIERRLEVIDGCVFSGGVGPNVLRDLLALKRDVAALRRVVGPERDAVARLARREFPQVTEALAYRFRDVYDQLVRLAEDAILLQDRATGLVDAFLSTQSNRLNQVMKVLTIMSTIFMPLSVVVGIWGMNVALPAFPGGASAQIWWIVGIMLAIGGGMLMVFRRLRWL